jgi:SPP1 family predicted phage head-tail adaptor
LTTAKGNEKEIAGKEQVSATHKIFFKPDVSIIEKDRVVFDGNNYNVILVTDGAYRGHHLEVYLSRVYE